MVPLRKIIIWLALTASCTITSAECHCHSTDSVCEFFLEVDIALTMRHYRDMVYPDGGKLYTHHVTNTSAAEPVPLNEVISMNGWEATKLVIAVNHSIPGPDIVVYEGQRVVVHVKNKLMSAGLTMHWHGLPMRGTPWMDGVPFITQCPIEPGQTFRYEFDATPKGTYWYHSHTGTQTSMGVYGALIIKEQAMVDANEHILQISDWNHQYDSDALMQQLKQQFFDSRTPWLRFSIENTLFLVKMHSGLINGRGRYHDPVKGNNFAPLTVFEVASGQTYRFRVIGTGILYPFRVSVDNHKLRLVASDGHDLEPVEAESFYVQPGERFDFEIVATEPVGNYWIRGVTPQPEGQALVAEAILRYTGAPEEDPITQRQQCTETNVCVVVNCPFPVYPGDFITCLSFNDLKSHSIGNPAPAYVEGKFQEYFVNIGIIYGETVANAKVFHTPNVNLLAQPEEWQSPCDDETCDGPLCKCTYTFNIGLGDTVQLVLLNMGIGKLLAHPMHLHGHSFHVLKTGFGQFNTSSGLPSADNEDIDCRGNPDRKLSLCSNATWANPAWRNGNVPGLELERPPRKDTIIVPTGGYVVLRIKADNPGLWDFHCHVEFHTLLGMRVLLNESADQVPPAPTSFPECHSFPRGSIDEHVDPTTTTAPTTAATTMQECPANVADDMVAESTFWTVFGVLCAIIFLQFVVLTALYCHRRRTSAGYATGRANPGYVAK